MALIPSLVARMRAVTAAFFALPDEEKLKVRMPADRYRGYMVAAESLAASYGQESPPDLKGVTQHRARRTSMPATRTLDRRRLVPSSPTTYGRPNLPICRKYGAAYYREMERLATEIMRNLRTRPFSWTNTTSDSSV